MKIIQPTSLLLIVLLYECSKLSIELLVALVNTGVKQPSSLLLLALAFRPRLTDLTI